jgi:AcrR family transcriptional regulator
MEEALFQLMGQKSFSQITVTDIAERAGVSRLTFYRNFETKEDILSYHFDQLFGEYERNLAAGDFSIEEGVRQCFIYWKDHSSEIRMLMRQHLAPVMFAPFEKYARRVLEIGGIQDRYDDIQITFVVGGLFSSMVHMASTEEDWSVDDVANSVMRVINGG